MASNGQLTSSASTRSLMPPYPDRFYAAARYAAIPGTVEISPGSENLTPYSDLTCLALYSLYQQAANGPCKEPKPWAWNIVELAKWQSWKELGNMNAMEAMRLFVRALEEEDPEWWPKALELEAQTDTAAATDANTANKDSADVSSRNGVSPHLPAVQVPKPNSHSTEVEANPGEVEASPLPPSVTSIASQLVTTCQAVNTWAVVPTGGRRPTARYQHASIVLGGKVLVIGGNTGRFVNDVQVLDLSTLTWSKLEVTSSDKGRAPLPACAGHALATLDRSTVLIVGGHQKAGAKQPTERMTVLCLDLELCSWRPLKTTGEVPFVRGGHSATRVGDSLWIFGGEDGARHLLDDLYSLNLVTFVWTKVDTRGVAPCARCDHSATVYNDQFLTIFGGGSHSLCFNDIHFLDLQTGEWSAPVVRGVVPSARAGHAGVAVASTWFIVGGGDNTSGLCDTMVLDLDTLTWGTVTTAQERNAISSEGLTVVPVESPKGTLLLAFGGYNGKYNNELLVLRPSPELLGMTPNGVESEGERAGAAEATAAAGQFRGAEPQSAEQEQPKQHEPSPALWSNTDKGAVVVPNSRSAAAATGAEQALPTPTSATAAIVVSGMASSHSESPLSPLDQPATTFAVAPGKGEAVPSSVAAAATPSANPTPNPVIRALEKELEEALATAKAMEEVVLRERAKAFESAAEARADAWAAINKSQQEVKDIQSQLQQAVQARKQAEEEAAESAGRVAAAQAGVAAAQAEAQRLRQELGEARGRAQDLQAQLARAGADTELVQVKRDFAACKEALADAEKEVHASRALFSAEQARCFKLEVEVAELRQKLTEMQDLKSELEILRRQREYSEEVAAAAASWPARSGWGMFG